MLSVRNLISWGKTPVVVAVMVLSAPVFGVFYGNDAEPTGQNESTSLSDGSVAVTAKFKIGQLVTGIFQKYENGAAVVTLPDCEAILPRTEQIPGEKYQPTEFVQATVCEVRDADGRGEVILSRTRTELIRRLFEQEAPEIAAGVVTIKIVAREPGDRTKIAVSSSDPLVDCMGACVGVRGNRIKSVVDQLAGERIDVVRHSDDLQVFIRNALGPVDADKVLLYPMLGRAVALVAENQRALAMGNRGQNARLAGELCGLRLEILTPEELAERTEHAIVEFRLIEGIDKSLAENLTSEGFLSYTDLSLIKSDSLMKLSGLSQPQAETIIARVKRQTKK